MQGLLLTGARAVLGIALGEAFLGMVFWGAYSVHLKRTGGLPWPFIAAGIAMPFLVLFVLRAEDRRLARELRMARTASPLLRAAALARRQTLPKLLRPFSCTLGAAALSVADGDKGLSLSFLAQNPPFARGGELSVLSTLVTKDIARLGGSTAGLEEIVATLFDLSPSHPEVLRYRAHVLARAVMQRGDPAFAEAYLDAFGESSDPDIRAYGLWVRAWFEEGAIDVAPEVFGLATLYARSLGAVPLVQRLEALTNQPKPG